MKSKVYYGWVIAGTLAITETISWGILYYAFTVFITPMETELGWSRAELTGGFSLALLVMGVMAIPVGMWVDRHGARLLMTIGSIGAAALVVAWSQVHDRAAFYLIFAGIGVCAAAVLYEPAFAVMARWFVRKRSRALAVITFAAGLASTIFVPLSDALNRAVGWREAVFLLGIFLALTTILPHALILRRRPEDMGLMPDGDDAAFVASRPVRQSFTFSDAVHSRLFWVLTSAFGLAMLATTAIRVHFIPFLIESGVDPSSAALASGSIGLMQVVGRMIFAPLDSRVSTRNLAVGIFALEGVAMFLLLLGSSLWLVGGFVILFGAAYGAQTLARPTLTVDVFGVSHYGRISSVMALFLTLASTAAPVGAGLIYDHFGSYTPVLWLVIVLVVIGAGLMGTAKITHARD